MRSWRVKKFNHLISKQRDNKYLRPIHYLYSFRPSDVTHNGSSKFSFSFPKMTRDNPPDSTNIIINPPNTTPLPNLFSLRENWFVNLSSISIPEEIQSLLQLGDNFSLPFYNTDKLTIEFIKNVENNIHKLPIPAQMTIRTRSSSIFNNLPSFPFPDPPLMNIFKHLIFTTNKFLRENHNLILTRADKGNVTVAMDKDIYIRGMKSYYKITILTIL